jgi:hypothetical protein
LLQVHASMSNHAVRPRLDPPPTSAMLPDLYTSSAFRHMHFDWGGRSPFRQLTPWVIPLINEMLRSDRMIQSIVLMIRT